jgi:hypothetical protein
MVVIFTWLRHAWKIDKAKFWMCPWVHFHRQLAWGDMTTVRVGDTIQRLVAWMEQKAEERENSHVYTSLPFLGPVHIFLPSLSIDIRFQIHQPLSMDSHQQFFRGLLVFQPLTWAASLGALVLPASWTEQLLLFLVLHPAGGHYGASPSLCKPI